jgi:hypothetical protein
MFRIMKALVITGISAASWYYIMATLEVDAAIMGRPPAEVALKAGAPVALFVYLATMVVGTLPLRIVGNAALFIFMIICGIALRELA